MHRRTAWPFAEGLPSVLNEHIVTLLIIYNQCVQSDWHCGPRLAGRDGTSSFPDAQ